MESTSDRLSSTTELKERVAEASSAPPSSRRSRPLSLAGFIAIASTIGPAATGCAQTTQRGPRATPAAQRDAEDRPLDLQPPLNLLRDQGTDSDGIVRIVSEVTCTGMLIADDLVLTAHHCVSARDAEGRVISRDQDPSEVAIELGGDYLPWGEVAARAIISPDCGYRSGDGDIAIIVLSRKLIGIPTVNPRLDEGPRRGERVAPVGFGRCAASPDAIHRVVRDGRDVTVINDGQFIADASICPGDSGGPAYGEGGDVMGVISASVMDGDDRTVGPSVFTRLDVWRQLFSAAKEISAGASPSELPPYRSCIK